MFLILFFSSNVRQNMRSTIFTEFKLKAKLNNFNHEKKALELVMVVLAAATILNFSIFNVIYFLWEFNHR